MSIIFEAHLSNALPIIELKAPDLSDSQIIGYNVGVRPYRTSGVRIESEYLNNKLIIHNYGYGGSGLTLCWGGAAQAIELMQKEVLKNSELAACKTVAVLGAGVIGLATAYDLMALGYSVHIYAESFPPHTTSNVAAGIWSPPAFAPHYSQKTKDSLTTMLKISEERFLKSLNYHESGRMDSTWLTTSGLAKNPEFLGIEYMKDYSFEQPDSAGALSSDFGFSHDLTGQLVDFHFDNGVKKIGIGHMQLHLDGPIFMNDLFTKVAAQATITEKHFDSGEDIMLLDESIIINCTSLGSRELFNDHEFNPVRGQLIYVKKQPDIDYIVHEDVPGSNNFWVTLYPLSDRLLIGGVLEYGKEELTVHHDVLDALLQNARNCFLNNLTIELHGRSRP